jgi:hypothetical protein
VTILRWFFGVLVSYALISTGAWLPVVREGLTLTISACHSLLSQLPGGAH